MECSLHVRESYIEKKVVAWARAHDILPLKLSAHSDTGWPDRFWLFYYPAVAFIEFKAPGGKPRVLQLMRIAELQRRGYPVEVISNVEEGIRFLSAALLGAALLPGASRTHDGKPSVRGPVT